MYQSTKKCVPMPQILLSQHDTYLEWHDSNWVALMKMFMDYL